MAEINLDLVDFFEKTFGYTTTAFDPKFKQVSGDQGSLGRGSATGASGSDYYAIGNNGREYYMPIKIVYPGPDITLPDGSVTSGLNVDLYLPYPVFSISSRKTIIETPLTERRGTVKELINIEDYQISVKGFIIGTTNEFPEADVTTLVRLYENNTAISIHNPMTDIFLLRPDRSGSDKVVIKDLEFPEVKGVKNVRAYSFKLLSDEPFNLTDIS